MMLDYTGSAGRAKVSAAHECDELLILLDQRERELEASEAELRRWRERCERAEAKIAQADALLRANGF